MGRWVAEPRAPGGRALRIGVIHAGRIVEERLVEGREAVTLGASPTCSVVVPDETFGARRVLLEPRAGGWAIEFDDAMSGKVARAGGAAADLAALRRDPATERPRAGTYRVPLDPVARGKVTAGDVTVLFQFVDPPPPVPRPVLPASMRGGVLAEADWGFAAIVATLSLFLAPTLWWLERVPIPKEVELAAVPDRFAKFITAVPATAPEEPRDVAAGEAADEDAPTDEPSPAAAAAAASARERSKTPRSAAEEKARILESAGKAGLLGIIGSEAPGGGGTVSDVLGGPAWVGDVDDAFEDLGGVIVDDGKAPHGLGGRSGLEGGSGKVEDLAPTEGIVTGVDSAEAGDKGPERVPAGRVTDPLVPPRTDGGLPPEVVAEVVRRRLSGVVTCYVRGLKRAPGLAGKIRVRFTINAAGRVDDGATSVVEDTMGDEGVRECTKETLGRWRFPESEDRSSTTVEYPFVFTSSAR